MNIYKYINLILFYKKMIYKLIQFYNKNKISKIVYSF